MLLYATILLYFNVVVVACLVCFDVIGVYYYIWNFIILLDVIVFVYVVRYYALCAVYHIRTHTYIHYIVCWSADMGGLPGNLITESCRTSYVIYVAVADAALPSDAVLVSCGCYSRTGRSTAIVQATQVSALALLSISYSLPHTYSSLHHQHTHTHKH